MSISQVVVATRHHTILILLLTALPALGHAQTGFYAYPNVGSLALDIDPEPTLGVRIDEGVLWGAGMGYLLTGRVAVEGHYAGAGFEVGAEGFDALHGRLHFVSAGVRVAFLARRSFDLTASLSPGVLIETNEITDATRNFVLPVAADLLLLPDRRIRPRVSVRDFLHLCDAPDELDGILCEDGEWLHHVAVSVGAEFEL